MTTDEIRDAMTKCKCAIDGKKSYLVISNGDTVVAEIDNYVGAEDIAIDWKQNQSEDDVVIAVVKYEVVTDYRIEEL